MTGKREKLLTFARACASVAADSDSGSFLPPNLFCFKVGGVELRLWRCPACGAEWQVRCEKESGLWWPDEDQTFCPDCGAQGEPE